MHANSKAPSKAVIIAITYIDWPGKANFRTAPVVTAMNTLELLIDLGTLPENIRIVTDYPRMFSKADQPNIVTPTKANINAKFRWLKEGAKDGDVLFLFYSGHGTEIDPVGTNPSGRASSKALLTLDAYVDEKDVADDSKWPARPKLDAKRVVTGEDFYGLFGDLQNTAINLTAVYDCCHSVGAFRDFSTPKTDGSSYFTNVTNRAIGEKRYGKDENTAPHIIGFAAAQGWQVAWASVNTGETMFGKNFNEFLGEGNNAKLTNNQVIEGIKARMPNLADRSKFNDKDGNKITETQDPELLTTTAKKAVPFFADLTRYPEALSAGALTRLSSIAKAPGIRDFGDDGSNRDFGEESRDIGAADLERMVNVYSQIATNSELQNLRTQNRGLFDVLIQKAVPFALQAGKAALSAYTSSKRDIGHEAAFQQHLPTAINFAHQVTALPEVQENRGLFDSIFRIGMPLVFNTAQALLGQKRRGLENDDAQRGLLDVLAGGINCDVGGTRGIFSDIMKKVAPIILSVASSAVNSFSGQRSLSVIPTDRGFFSFLKNAVSKVVSNPMVQKFGAQAVNFGVQALQSRLSGGQRDISEPTRSFEQQEAQVRGFFGNMLQTLVPVAMNALQGALAPRRRDIALPEERGIFDMAAKYLPAVIQFAQQQFAQRRALGTTGEDEAQFIMRVLSTATPALIHHTQTQQKGECLDVLLKSV